jgi:RNA polymerase sigma factor (sigma-70 family)
LKHWSDEKLVAECLGGNERAWTSLIDRYKRLIYSIPLKYHLSPEDAGDIFQNVCLELFSELPRLREAAALRKWLVTVTAHQCYHFKQKQGRTEPYGGDGEREDGSELGLPEGMLEQLQQESVLRQAVTELPPRCRKMVEMLFFEEQPVSYADLARQMGLAVGSIGFIRGRCLKRLRKLLEERGF